MERNESELNSPLCVNQSKFEDCSFFFVKKYFNKTQKMDVEMKTATVNVKFEKSKSKKRTASSSTAQSDVVKKQKLSTKKITVPVHRLNLFYLIYNCM